MSDDRDVDSEYYEEQEWSEQDLAKLVRREVRMYTDRKLSTLFEDVGIFRLDGSLTIEENSDGDPRVQVDYFHLDEFIAKNFQHGDDITVIVMQGELTNRDDKEFSDA